MQRAVPALICLALLGCQSRPFADLDNKKDYARYGVSFEYPGNWALTETEAGKKDGAALHVTTLRASSGSGAVVTIQSFEERMKLEVGAWADRLTKDYDQRFASLPQTLEVGDRHDLERQLFGETRAGLVQRFKVTDGDRSEELNAEFFVAEFAGGTATVFVQASIEDFERGQAGFDLVLNSLKWTRPAPDRETPTIDIVAPPRPDGTPDWGAARGVGASGGAEPASAEGAPSPQKVEVLPSSPTADEQAP